MPSPGPSRPGARPRGRPGRGPAGPPRVAPPPRPPPARPASDPHPRPSPPRLGGGEGPGLRSAEVLDQPDDHAGGAADVAVPVDVLVLRDLAHEFGAVGAEAVEDLVDGVDEECEAR